MGELFSKYKSKLFTFILLTTIVIGLFNIFFAQRLELITYDLRTLLRKKPADPNIVIVDIDNRTINRAAHEQEYGLGRWPWPRPAYSKVLKFISNGNPKIIIADFNFETDTVEYKNPQFNDNIFVQDLKDIKNIFFVQAVYISKLSLQKFFDTAKQTDELSEENIQQGNQDIQAYIKNLIAQGPGQIIEKFSYGSIVTDNVRDIPAIRDYLVYFSMPRYLRGIYEYSTGIGINIVQEDDDGVLRSLQPVYVYNGRYFFSIELAAASFLNNNKNNVELNKYELKFGNISIPLSRKLKYYINWREKVLPDKEVNQVDIRIKNKLHYKSVSFIDVFHNDISGIKPEIFKDKIVLVGGTANKLGDYFTVPNSEKFYGIDIIATSLDNFLNDNQFVYRVSEWLNWLITFALMALIIICFKWFPVKKSYYYAILLSIAIIVIFIFLNLGLFSYMAIWVSLVNPVFCTTITIISVVSLSLLIEKDKRSFIENTFSKYVSPQIYKQLASKYEEVSLSAYRAEISVLFSDIRGFTPFTEDLTPEEVSRYLNEYFTKMVEVILKHDGTIDKFMGDAIMAFFGAPIHTGDHARRAASAAIEMMETLEALNNKWSQQGRRLINIGIGINTGSALIGNFGSPQLMDYTVIGDTVNLASRLESLNKAENTNILISAFTYQKLKDEIEVQIIGPRTVKGKSESIVVYELLGFKEQ